MNQAWNQMIKDQTESRKVFIERLKAAKSELKGTVNRILRDYDEDCARVRHELKADLFLIEDEMNRMHSEALRRQSDRFERKKKAFRERRCHAQLQLQEKAPIAVSGKRKAQAAPPVSSTASRAASPYNPPTAIEQKRPRLDCPEEATELLLRKVCEIRASNVALDYIESDTFLSDAVAGMLEMEIEPSQNAEEISTGNFPSPPGSEDGEGYKDRSKFN